MTKLLAIGALLFTAAGCAGHGTEPATLTSQESFLGTWRSVTVPVEFARLTIESLSSEQGALGTRLTLSGVYWDGSGRIERDSLVARMTMSSSTVSNGELVARPAAGDTMHVVLRPDGGDALSIRFVRER